MNVNPANRNVAQPSLAAGSPGILARGSATNAEQGCSAQPQAGKPALQRAFTLIEMLVVIAIIGIIAAISVPAIKNFQKSNADVAATQQLLDDVARARQFAIATRSTVYMVFVPANFWNDAAYTGLNAAQRGSASNLLDKQMIGYSFVSLRDVGDQPGVNHPRYLAEWRAMPEGMFIAPYKFNARTSFIDIMDPNKPATYRVFGFNWVQGIPFPVADATNTFVLPCLAFNSTGQLVSDKDSEIIPLARGKAIHALDVNKKPLQSLPTLEENPPGNSTNSAFNLIVIDRLTGRAHVERQKPS